MKTAEFGQPVANVPQPGVCRICHCISSGPPTASIEPIPVEARVCTVGEPPNRRYCRWTDGSRTLCDNPECIAEAKREIGR